MKYVRDLLVLLNKQYSAPAPYKHLVCLNEFDGIQISLALTDNEGKPFWQNIYLTDDDYKISPAALVKDILKLNDIYKV